MISISLLYNRSIGIKHIVYHHSISHTLSIFQMLGQLIKVTINVGNRMTLETVNVLIKPAISHLLSHFL